MTVACHSSSSISLKRDHLATTNSSRWLLQPINFHECQRGRKASCLTEGPLGCTSRLLWLSFPETSLFESSKNTFIFVPSHNFQSPWNEMKRPAEVIHSKNWYLWANFQESPQLFYSHTPKKGPQSSAEGFWWDRELSCLPKVNFFHPDAKLRKTKKAGQKSK